MTDELNYHTRLNAWAMEMAIRAHGAPYNLTELMADTTALAKFAYSKEGDFNDCVARIGEILKTEPDKIAGRIAQFRGELDMVEEQYTAQFAKHTNGATHDRQASN